MIEEEGISVMGVDEDGIFIMGVDEYGISERVGGWIFSGVWFKTGVDRDGGGGFGMVKLFCGSEGGSKYVHEAITKIVTRILDEQHQVPGISFPLQTVIPETIAAPRANIIGKSSNDDDAHMVDDDVHSPDGGVHMTKEEDNDDNVQKDNVDADVIEDVNDIGDTGADAGTSTATNTSTQVVDLDDYSDNDMVAAMNPSIDKRLMTRRKGKVVVQSSPKRKVAPKSPFANSIKKKSTSTGPIKSRAVSQSVGPTKSWSKVVPKKRKAQAIVDSDSDVDVDVQDIPLRKKPTTSKLAASVPEVPINNISFHYPSSVNRWKYFHHKRLALERKLAQNVLENKEIMDLIHEVGLMKTVVHLPKCYEMLVKEFIVNLSEDCADRKSKDFRKVYVRGKCVIFSSTVINNFLGRSNEAQPELEVSDNKICEVITAKQVKGWPLKGKLSASKLSIKYAMLHKIGAANWVPTNHKSTVATMLGKFIYAVGTKTKFNYGTYIFDQTMKHAGSFSVKGPIAFPSIICGIILNQESALSFHYKLFQGTHVPNIVTTSAGTSKDNTSTGKDDVIAMLRETCKELESRKLALEKLISSLEMEEGAEFAVNEEAGPEADDEQEDDSDEVEEEEASPDDGTDEKGDEDSSGGS
ncbi:uncharacterized protein LOC131658876 [Vicia villosa]|uniref:uncharacterized protein LOC131658876 n=1 Tax=Vicia villosa TaxID=3911 RepID=UPI00273A9459|nr:uncharacterized protein LOC131658876 [Vicia villosa]